MTATLWRGVVVGALAGLLFGFDTAVVSGTVEALRHLFSLSPGSLGVTVSSALWGTLVGALTAGQPGDRYGARTCLRWVALLYLLSAVGCLFAWSWSALLVFRFLAGLAVGGSSVLAPVYIAEIAPRTRRGALVGVFQLNIVVGILVAYLSNYLLGTLALGDLTWRVKFGVAAVPALVLLSLLFTIPHSPRWLAVRGRLPEAQQALHSMGITEIDIASDDVQRSVAGVTARLSWSVHRRPMLLAIAIAAFNQLSGINAVLYYLNDIFVAAGFDSVSADKQAVVIGLLNLIFTAIALLLIDRLGRRTLLLIGSVGLTAALAGIALIMITGQHRDLLLWLLGTFIAFFACSQGAVIWVYISEIFPTDVRARGQALGSSTHWFMDAVIASVFPVIATVSTGAPFAFFAAMMAAQLIVVALFFPETKRLALERVMQSA